MIYKIAITIFIFIGAVFCVNSVQAANNDFTIQAWIKAASSTADLAIVVKDSEVRLITDASGKPACQIHNGTAWQTAAVSDQAASLNAWYFTACVYDGSNIKVYVDAVEKAGQSETNDVNNTANPWRIGSDAGGDL